MQAAGDGSTAREQEGYTRGVAAAELQHEPVYLADLLLVAIDQLLVENVANEVRVSLP